MISFLRYCTIILAGFYFLILSFGVAPLRAEQLSGKHLNVVELFTSQGCSSCPPADLVLKSYTKRADVIALSYSVDYWDYLGWRDTFGKAAHSQRQRDYALSRGDGEVYTPQAVVNGVSHVNGAHKAEIETAMKNSEALLNKQQVALLPSKQDGQIKVQLQAVRHDIDQPLILWMLRVKNEGTVKVKRGENGGRVLSYHNIVLGAEKAALMKEFRPSVMVKAPKRAMAKDERLVFLLQIGSTGPIVGAAQLR